MADVNSLYTVTPRQAARFIEDILYAGLVPNLESSPGMGKSSIYRQVAKKLNLCLIDQRVSTMDTTDFTGLPHFVNGFAKFSPFEDMFPIESTPVPKGYDGWLVFLDEYNAGPKAIQAASYKLILDKMVGLKRLHERVAMGLAGNLATDRAIVNPLSTAAQSRLIHLKMVISFKEWMEDVAIPENYDFRVKAYLSQFESKLMDFDPAHTERTFCCPRTWEFVNRLIEGKEVTDDIAVLLAGTITSGVAVEFVQFCQIYKNLISISQIMASPQSCTIPYETNLKWATVCHMMEKVTNDNFDDLSIYANRFSLDFRILFFRSIMARKETKHLRQHPAFAKAQLELSRYLNG